MKHEVLVCELLIGVRILKLQGAEEQLNLLLFLAVIWQVKMAVRELECPVNSSYALSSLFFFFISSFMGLTSQLLNYWASGGLKKKNFNSENQNI